MVSFKVCTSMVNPSWGSSLHSSTCGLRHLFETFSPFPIIPVGPVLKASLSQLERVLLVMDGILHGSDVALLLLDLLPGRLHLVLQLLLCPLHLVVALPEVEVGGILLDPQVVAGLLDRVEDGLPQPLTLSHRLLSHHLVVLREGVPSLRNDASLKKVFLQQCWGIGACQTIRSRFRKQEHI